MRRLIAMLIVVLLLGGFWYFHDIKGSEQKRETERIESRVFPDFKSEDIQSITWSDGAQTPETVRHFIRLETGWAVELPGKLVVRVDSGRFKGMCRSVAELSKIETICEAPKPEDLKVYGLDKPLHRMTLEYKDAQGKVNKATLVMGNELLDSSGSYARLEKRGENTPVLAVSGVFITDFMSTMAELREKRFFTFSPSRIRSFKYTSYEGTKPGSFTLTVEPKEKKEEKGSFLGLGKKEVSKQEQNPENAAENEEQASMATDSRWYVTDNSSTGKQERVLADLRTCNNFIWDLQSLDVASFLLPTDQKDFGKVRARFEISIDGAKQPFTYEFGQAVRGRKNCIYAKRTYPEEYFILDYGDKATADSLRLLFGKRFDNFVDRHLASTAAEDVQHFIVSTNSKRPQGAFVVEAQRVSNGWKLIKPEHSINNEGKKLETVNDLLYGLLDLEWAIKEPAAKDAASKAEVLASFKLYGANNEILADVSVCADGPDRYAVYTKDGQKLTLHKDPRIDWIKACEKLESGTTSEERQEASAQTENKQTTSAGQTEGADTPADTSSKATATHSTPPSTDAAK